MKKRILIFISIVIVLLLTSCIFHNTKTPAFTNQVANYKFTTDDFYIMGQINEQGTIYNILFLAAWGGDGYSKIMKKAKLMGGDDVINFKFDIQKIGFLTFIYNTYHWNASATVIKYKDKIFYKKFEQVEKIFQDGSKYKGTIIEGKKNGYGVLIDKNGNEYKGQFKNDMKDGKGILKYKNNDVYEGQFKNDKKEGNGVFKFKNYDKYEGQFKNDEMHGKGIYIYDNGNKYVGELKNNEINGYGTFYYNTREKYVGEFKDGKRNGAGLFYDKHGNKTKGKWIDDKLVE